MLILTKDEKLHKNRHIHYFETGADSKAVKRIVYCGDCVYLDYDPEDDEYFRCGVSGDLIDSPKQRVPTECPCRR